MEDRRSPLEGLVLIQQQFWKDKKVFVTGHTGFKGSWLSLWLHQMGAQVKGFSLAPTTTPNHFSELQLAKLIDSEIGDIRKPAQITESIQSFEPEILFHLAAQPLVRYSYSHPVETFETNVMGTLNVLQACRSVDSLKVIVVVTSDKCYENNETGAAFKEEDPMGGLDPYSASKGCCELLTTSIRHSFFDLKKIGIASVRAGNVIGGGDWSTDRLIPDAIKSFSQNKEVLIRNPHSIRPWQHVLEPLSGYLKLTEKLWSRPSDYSGGWNFGAEKEDSLSVQKIMDLMVEQWGENAQWISETQEQQPYEAKTLLLDSSKAKHKLEWQPKLNVQEAIQMTTQWYKDFYKKKSTQELSSQQIQHFLGKKP